MMAGADNYNVYNWLGRLGLALANGEGSGDGRWASSDVRREGDGVEDKDTAVLTSILQANQYKYGGRQGLFFCWDTEGGPVV